MEEVVGFVFHLDVQVSEQPAARVGVVTDGAGKPTKIAAPLVESGPDPDGPGVEVHTVGGPDLDEPELGTAEEPERETAFTRPKISAKGLDVPGNRRRVAYSAPGEDGSVATTTAAKPKSEYDGVGRNAPCPCGSGKKFKMCHGRPGAS